MTDIIETVHIDRHGVVEEWVVDSETTHPDGTESITLRSKPMVTEIHTPEAILATRMDPNEAGAATIRDYLIRLLADLWDCGESFSSKRPFGTSGWHNDLYRPLLKAGHVAGRFDERGYIEEIDRGAADRSIAAAIQALGEEVPGADG